jgi:hypothetical protein
MIFGYGMFFFFWLPEFHNDINVLDRSLIYSNLAQGRATPVNYTINDHNYTVGYYLPDGIHPWWATFIETNSSPQGNRRKHFVAS